MKSLFVLCALIYSGSLAFSQQECMDVIYASEENKVLLDCCILEVINRNLVIFHKAGESDSDTIAANAIIKDGQYIELTSHLQPKPDHIITNVYDPGKYNGYTYEHYEKIFKRARSLQFFGIALSASGLGMIIAGSVKLNQETDYYSSDNWNNLQEAGIIIMSIGMPLFIAGSILKSNNRKVMIKINEQKGLALGLNSSGIGLTYKF